MYFCCRETSNLVHFQETQILVFCIPIFPIFYRKGFLFFFGHQILVASLLARKVDRENQRKGYRGLGYLLLYLFH